MAWNDLNAANQISFGHGSVFKGGRSSQRIVYPAEVVNNNDSSEQGRITARIISLDENGVINGGRDREVPTENLVICQSLMPQFFHAMPAVGEMVYVILENPSDNSAPRYWIGPIVTSKQKLKTQPYSEAVKTFDITDFYSNKNSNNKAAGNLFPKPSEIAVQGKEDADLILRRREVFLTAGKFDITEQENIDYTKENLINPSNLQLKQYAKSEIAFEGTEEERDSQDFIRNFSQANLTSSNINIFSPEGAWRNPNEMKKFESNKFLKTFGNFGLITAKDGELKTANHLHPIVFGDELIKLLDLMIRILINHTHTPHKSAIPSSELTELATYLIPNGITTETDSPIYKLLSRHVRTN